MFKSTYDIEAHVAQFYVILLFIAAVILFDDDGLCKCCISKTIEAILTWHNDGVVFMHGSILLTFFINKEKVKNVPDPTLIMASLKWR